MHITDLRIGNIVNFRFEYDAKGDYSASGVNDFITEIGYASGDAYIRGKNTGFRGVYLEYNGEPHVLGVPISENWLIRMGFKRMCHQYCLSLIGDDFYDFTMISEQGKGFSEVVLYPFEDFRKYKYVHEVQNLYFAITGNELDISIK